MKCIKLRGSNLLVDGAFVPSVGFTHYDVEIDPDAFDIDAIFIESTDVTELLSADLDEIEQIVLEQYYS
jgi:hypothetical protein